MQKTKKQGTENILEPFFDAILHSIIADMRNRKLLHSYIALELDVSMYETNLYKVVFLLVGIKDGDQNEALRDWYDHRIDLVRDVEIHNDEKIRILAGDILLGLMEWKTKKK
ncbi:MAG: hypothetical protein ACO1N0_10780 [Fluviicola sp.]